jgi:pentatricopeptide repeat protein
MCSVVAAARSVFDGMPVGLRDLISWTAMVSCLSQNGAEAEALRLFGETLEEGLLPNAFTLCAATQACFASELFHCWCRRVGGGDRRGEREEGKENRGGGWERSQGAQRAAVRFR